MDLLDSILSSMQKPPTASEAQKKAKQKEKEALERNMNAQKHMLNKFRKRVQEKIENFIKDGTKPYLQFDPLDNVYRSIIREVSEVAGLQVFSFCQDVERYCVVYHKDKGPNEDEIAVRRSGGIWDEEIAAEMALKRLEMRKQNALDNEENTRKRRRNEEAISGTFYKQKYAHLIGETAAIKAAQKTNMNKNYGEVPSENKKDQRSIEQTMADIKAKKMKKIEAEAENE